MCTVTAIVFVAPLTTTSLSPNGPTSVDVLALEVVDPLGRPYLELRPVGFEVRHVDLRGVGSGAPMLVTSSVKSCMRSGLVVSLSR